MVALVKKDQVPVAELVTSVATTVTVKGVKLTARLSKVDKDYYITLHSGENLKKQSQIKMSLLVSSEDVYEDAMGIMNDYLIFQSNNPDVTPKPLIIKRTRKDKDTLNLFFTLGDAIRANSYTLQVGRGYERERGNKKINCNPTSAASLVTNLNNASNNAAANGYSGIFYRLAGS